MVCPLARQVTLGKGRPDTPHLMRWLASFIFTICVDIIDREIVDRYCRYRNCRYVYLSSRSVSEADGLHHHQGELDCFLRSTVDIIDIIYTCYTDKYYRCDAVISTSIKVTEYI